MIRYLKDERLGRLTLLPLNKIKPQPPLPPLAGNGVVDYAINLIDFDPEYRDAFNLVFGQTVVVETLDAGRRLMGRYRMVTLEGELLERGGAMTGGIDSQRSPRLRCCRRPASLLIFLQNLPTCAMMNLIWSQPKPVTGR